MAQEKWLVMVYLAGDNNLSDECVYALTEMKKVMTDRVKVVAQFDPRGSKIPVHRYELNKNYIAGAQSPAQTGAPGSLAEDVVPFEDAPDQYPYNTGNRRLQQARNVGIDEPDTGSPKALFDFISWSVRKHKADRHLLILAGHGAGTEEDFLLKDENPTSSLSIPELRDVFQAVQDVIKVEIDILGMDVCLMSMAEVCYELFGLVKYLVASESYSPRAGWPYQKILSALDDGLRSGGTVAPGDLAKTIVKEYTRFYSDYIVSGLSVDLAALDISASGDLVGEVKILAEAIKRELGRADFRDATVLAHWEAQSYNGEQFVDLYDFCHLLSQRCAQNGVRDACEKVMETLRGRLVMLSCFDGIKYQYSYGLSLYFPWAEVVPYYQLLKFAQDAGWYDFLEAYVNMTRRQPRGAELANREYFSVKDVERFRKTSLHGPDEDAVVRSMRNPPQSLAYVPDCVEDKGQFIRTFESVRFR